MAQQLHIDDNLITRMRAHIATTAAANASVGNTTTVAMPFRPLVAIYHLDTGGGDATIIVGSEKHLFVDTGYDWVANRMCDLANALCPSGPSHIAVSHFDKDHFYGMGNAWNRFKQAQLITPADPDHLRWAAHISTCRNGGKPPGFTVADPDLIGVLQQMYRINQPGGGGSRKRSRTAMNIGATPHTSSEPARSCNSTEHPCSDAPQDGLNPTFIAREPAGAIALGNGVVMSPLRTGFVQTDLTQLRRKNDSSLAWKLSAGGINYYTAGDLETRESGLQVDNLHIIKCGHHGSEAATSAAFLGRANAKVAIIQGAHHQFTHPHAEVLQRLQDNNVDVYATGVHIDYEAQDVSSMVVAGDNQTHAGDIVIVIWEAAYFSVCYMNAGALTVRTYRDRQLLDQTAGAHFDAVIRACLALDTHTQLSAAMNQALLQKKNELPATKPKFSEYKQARPGDRSAAKRPKRVWKCFVSSATAPCTAPVNGACDNCDVKLCADHATTYYCDEIDCPLAP